MGTEWEVRMRMATSPGNGAWSAVATGRTLAADAPKVTLVDIESDPASGDTYGLGEVRSKWRSGSIPTWT